MEKIDPRTLETHSFDWGIIKWLVTPHQTPDATFTVGEVVLLPGEAHARHNHPESEEVLYILSGEGQQMVNDNTPFVISAGDSLHIPAGIYHATVNTGWAPLRFIAIYNPGGPEQVLTGLPDFVAIPPEEVVHLVRQNR